MITSPVLIFLGMFGSILPPWQLEGLSGTCSFHLSVLTFRRDTVFPLSTSMQFRCE
jgi:hypothetical protein